MDNNKICEILESLGLTKTEVSIYLSLIKRGKASAYRISKEANLYKANTYMAIDSLVRKNLVIKEIKENKQIFQAVSPEELVGNLDRQKEKLQEIIPFIQRNINEELEEVSVFTGVDSLFNIFYKLLEKKQPKPKKEEPPKKEESESESEEELVIVRKAPKKKKKKVIVLPESESESEEEEEVERRPLIQKSIKKEVIQPIPQNKYLIRFV